MGFSDLSSASGMLTLRLLGLEFGDEFEIRMTISCKVDPGHLISLRHHTNLVSS
jgi:hypothetical protein